MIDYAQIAAEAAELSHQFWAEIEEELTRQALSLRGTAATSDRWLSESDTVRRESAPDADRPHVYND